MLRTANDFNQSPHQRVEYDLDLLPFQASLRQVVCDWYGESVKYLPPGLRSHHPYFIDQLQLQQIQELSKLCYLALQPLRAEDHSFGLFTCYDLHFAPDGPKIIEINTNAGGAWLNLAWAGQQHLHLTDADVDAEVVSPIELAVNPSDLELSFKTMILKEWELFQRNHHKAAAPLTQAAIVDQAPWEQFLAGEFVLAQKIMQAWGINCAVLGPSEIQEDGEHWYFKSAPENSPVPVQWIYNRLTDFDFSLPEHAVLHRAQNSGGVMISPHPDHYRQFAHKQRLIELLTSCPDSMIPTDWEQLCRAIPEAKWITAEQQEYWWTQRKQYFFKPMSSYGSKGVYRGDKMTRGVWNQIITDLSQTPYMAQEVVPAMTKMVFDEHQQLVAMKADLRVYVYRDQVILLAARLYRGQTTNFRTSGGGFAPVYLVKDSLTSLTRG